MQNDKLSWQEHFDLIKWYINKYIEDNEFEPWFSDKPAKVTFIIDDLNHSKNACARKVGDDSYEIVIFAGLIKEFIDRSYYIVRDRKGIFSPVSRDESNNEAIGNCQIYLLFIWIEYIFFHELGHIDCGHLDVLNSNLMLEVTPTDNKIKQKITNYQLQRLEAQADGFAIRNMLGGLYLRNWKSFSSGLYGEENHKQLLRDHLLAIYYLFKIFDDLNPDKDHANARHPSPFIRANVCWFKLKQFYPQVDELPKLTDEELAEIVYRSFMEFYVNEYSFSKSDFSDETGVVSEFMLTITDTLKELGLPTL